jgi:hypothetical protein
LRISPSLGQKMIKIHENWMKLVSNASNHIDGAGDFWWFWWISQITWWVAQQWFVLSDLLRMNHMELTWKPKLVWFRIRLCTWYSGYTSR